MSVRAAQSALAQFCRASGRSQRGIYGGVDKMFGNNVSHSQRKTRRCWNPNVQTKRLFSDALDDWMKFRITTHALRLVDKAGGIDNYLLGVANSKCNPVMMKAKLQIQDAIKTKAVPKV